MTTDRRGYTVTGRRDSGYRGYTYQQSITPGRWRVNVQTPEGLLLGRIRFRVVEAGEDELVISEAILAEIDRVFHYPKITKCHRWHKERIRIFIEDLARLATLTPKAFLEVLRERSKP